MADQEAVDQDILDLREQFLNQEFDEVAFEIEGTRSRRIREGLRRNRTALHGPRTTLISKPRLPTFPRWSAGAACRRTSESRRHGHGRRQVRAMEGANTRPAPN